MTDADLDATTSNTEQFEEVGRLMPVVEQWFNEARPPQAPESLLDLVEMVAPAPGSVAVDLGAYSGLWAARIAARYGCATIALEVAPSPLRDVPAGVIPVNADLQHLPLQDGSVGLVWCRDTLSMVPNPSLAIYEISRVVAPGAGAVIYTAVTTPRLEPLEAAELMEALQMPSWRKYGRQPIDDAIAASDLELVHTERISPEYQEHALSLADPELLHDLIMLGRLERERPALEAATSPAWAARFRAWSAWPVYLLLGKLQTVVWVVRKPQ